MYRTGKLPTSMFEGLPEGLSDALSEDLSGEGCLDCLGVPDLPSVIASLEDFASRSFRFLIDFSTRSFRREFLNASAIFSRIFVFGFHPAGAF